MITNHTQSAAHVEVTLLLSASDVFKAARMGGMAFDEAYLKTIWADMQRHQHIRAEITASAAYALHILLSEISFDAVFMNPSPFIIDDSY